MAGAYSLKDRGRWEGVEKDFVRGTCWDSAREKPAKELHTGFDGKAGRKRDREGRGRAVESDG